MLKKTKALIAAGAATLVLAGGSAVAAEAASTQPAQWQEIACVHYGTPGSAAGNTMEYDYNDSACPPGTYRVHLANYPDVDPTATVTVTAIPTGTSTATAAS